MADGPTDEQFYDEFNADAEKAVGGGAEGPCTPPLLLRGPPPTPPGRTLILCTRCGASAGTDGMDRT